MLNKKIMAITIITLILLLISSVGAAENTDEDIISVDDANKSVVCVNNQLESDESSFYTNDTALSESSKTFTMLDSLINDNDDAEIYLDGNYTFVSRTDNNFKDGIVVNRTVTIYGNGFTLDSNKFSRIFNVSNNNVVFRDIVFVNGYSNGDGGAIYGVCTAINCYFINNSAANSGGAMHSGSAVNCSFTDNSAVRYGGAMYRGSANNCIFINNNVDNDCGGAIIFVDAYDCSFINNTAGDGGGAIYGKCSAVNCSFIDNSAVNSGGAVYGACTAVDCIFSNNYGKNGGAMNGGSAVNCSFINNTASECGGAMKGFTDLSAENCFFSGNSASLGGAMYGYKFSARNCTFIDNSAVRNGGAIYGSGNYSAVNCSFINNSADICGAIYGECAAVNCTFINNTDNDPKTFTLLNDLINGKTNNDVYLNDNYTFVSLTDDNFKDGIAINRKVTVWGNGFTISGNDIARIFKVLNNNVVFRDIVFVNGYSNGEGGAIYGECAAVNCSFINNYADGEYGGGAMYHGSAVNCSFLNNFADGGGAISSGSALNCTFICNSANFGGAISDGSAENCIFINNTASEGGAMYGSNCFAVNCTFKGNNVLEEGGAMNGGSAVNSMFIGNSAFDGGAVAECSAVNCTFINNSAVNHDGLGFGGAMASGSAVNCSFIGNSAEYGGGMHRGTASYCIFKNNHAESSGDNVYLTEILNKFATSITAFNVIADYGTADNIGACLTNNDGEPIGGAALSVDMNGIKSFTTDFNGQINFTTKNLSVAKYTVKIDFAGDDNYLNSSITINVIINKINPSLTVNVNDINFGEDLIVNVHAPSDIKYRVNFSVGNKSKLVSLKNGVGTVKFNGLNKGNYVVTAYYGGYYVGDNNYLNSSVSTIVKVRRGSANINVIANSIGYGEDLVVNVQTTSDIKYRVNVSVGGMSKLVSLKNGVGSVKFSGLAIWSYAVTAYYGGYYVGDDNYLNSSVSTTVKVNKGNPNVQVTVGSIVYGDDLVVNLKLSSDVSRRVNVSVGGMSKLVSLKNGVGSVKFSGLAVGTYIVTASYGGDTII